MSDAPEIEISQEMKTRIEEELKLPEGVTAEQADQKSLDQQALSDYKELEKQATIDEKTGLYNGRKFNQDLQSEAVRAARASGKEARVGLIIIDLNDLKLWNEDPKYRFTDSEGRPLSGHDLGDFALKLIAKAMNASITRKEFDHAYRLSEKGDEFAILMPSASESAVKKIALRVKEHIAQLSQDAGAKIPVTGSIAAGILNDVEGKLKPQEAYQKILEEKSRVDSQGLQIAKSIKHDSKGINISNIAFVNKGGKVSLVPGRSQDYESPNT